MMGFFTGNYILKLDRKLRLSLPAAFRAAIKLPSSKNVNFFLFPSPQHPALEACTPAFMEKLNQAINQSAPLFSKTEDDMTWLFAEAQEMAVDDTGRFVMPEVFLSHASLAGEQNVVFVGHGTRFFIWNQENWQTFRQKRQPPTNMKLNW